MALFLIIDNNFDIPLFLNLYMMNFLLSMIELVSKLDFYLFKTLNQLTSSDLWNNFNLLISNKVFIIGVFCLMMLYVLSIKTEKDKNAMMIIIISAILCAGLNNFVLKPTFHRTRPCNQPILSSDNLDHLNKFIINNPTGCKKNSSMPSNHASFFSTLTASTLILGYPLIASALALFTILVGLSRIFLGVHFLSDIITGWMLGIIFSITVITIARWTMKKLKFDIFITK